jgi:hypothetical protein
MFRSIFIRLLAYFLTPAFFLVAVGVSLSARLKDKDLGRPRLFFGSVPILNNVYWSRAMRMAGYPSDTFTTDFYNTINKREDWDFLLSEEFKQWPALARPFLGFLRVLRSYDVLFISCQGVFIGTTPLWRLQAPLIKLAGIKTVVLPFGSDAYVYRTVRSTSLLHGLLASYPQQSKIQSRIAANVDYWCKHSDVFIPGVMNADGIGRWDVLMPSHLFIDTSIWSSVAERGAGDGTNRKVVVCHAPNHRGFKGTEFILEAIRQLQQEGLKVELRLIEKMQNTEVRRVLTEDADILVEQIIATGHALNGLEGMASGIPVVCNLEDSEYILPLRRWSYFGECPIVSATPENLVDVLRKLVTRPELRRQLGDAGRAYVEKYHGLDSAAHLFSEVIEYIQGRRDTLINMYHPLLGEYPKRLPKIIHPLVNNRIAD